MGLALGLLLYNILLLTVFLLGWPYLLFHCIVRPSVKWRQRCGLVPAVAGRPVWLHAASVGEATLVAPLVIELQTLPPAYGVVISTMTETGRQRAIKLFDGKLAVFFLPLDFPWSVLTALARVNPAAVVLTETELWPNLIWLCRVRNVPVFLVNARLSDRSLPYYRSVRFLFRGLLDSLRLIACQSSPDVEKYVSLGTDPGKVMNNGNIKYDSIRSAPSDAEKGTIRRKLGIDDAGFIMVAGSTREDEERIILEAWIFANQRSKISKSILILAPRHPERFDQVADLLQTMELAFTRRSQIAEGRSQESFSVLLLDTIGELVEAYAIADLAFVGGSLVPVGGHNPLEPAALGVPVVFGPHMRNAQESAQSLLEAGGAIQAAGGDDLREILSELLADPLKRRIIGQSAKAVVDSRRGVAKRTAELIMQGIGP